MERTALKIRIFGDPILRKKARRVDKITPYHRDILEGMLGLMRASCGIGLAAPQVGISESLIVVDIGTGIYKLINPRVIRKEGSQVIEEGCLSVPGVCIKVKRAQKVLIAACDEEGKSLSIEAEDLLACVFQHEIEHLKGRLIVDHASLLDKLRIRRKLEGLRKKVRNEGLPESETKSCKLQL